MEPRTERRGLPQRGLGKIPLSRTGCAESVPGLALHPGWNTAQDVRIGPIRRSSSTASSARSAGAQWRLAFEALTRSWQ